MGKGEATPRKPVLLKSVTPEGDRTERCAVCARPRAMYVVVSRDYHLSFCVGCIDWAMDGPPTKLSERVKEASTLYQQLVPDVYRRNLESE